MPDGHEAFVQLRIHYELEPELGVLASDLTAIDRGVREAIREVSTSPEQRVGRSGWLPVRASPRIEKARAGSSLEIATGEFALAVMSGVTANLLTEFAKAAVARRVKPKREGALRVEIDASVDRRTAREVIEWDWPER